VISLSCGHITISMLWGNTAYCVQLNGEDLSHYWNKFESVGLRKRPYYHYLTKSDVTILRALLENSWDRYVMKKLRHCYLGIKTMND